MLFDNIKIFLNIYIFIMSYNVNGIVNNTPTGSILAYFGNTDPPGWVICDGAARTNNSDSKYTGLAALSIGTGGTGTSNYTPPDLRGSFLRGTGTHGTKTIYAGPTLKSSQDMAILNHGHITNAHRHQTATNANFVALQLGTNTGESFDNSESEPNIQNSYRKLTELDTDNVTVTMSTNSINIDPNLGTIATNEVRPFNYGVNWILKL